MQAEAAEAARRHAQREAELRNGPAPDFDAEEDAETLKARAWDDWKVRLATRGYKTMSCLAPELTVMCLGVPLCRMTTRTAAATASVAHVVEARRRGGLALHCGEQCCGHGQQSCRRSCSAAATVLRRSFRWRCADGSEGGKSV